MERNNSKQINFEEYPKELNFSEIGKQIPIFKDGYFPILTEQRAQFGRPVKNPKIVTRKSRLEQFWWNEYYEQYLREIEKRIQPHPIPNSEYTDTYTKDLQNSGNEELLNKYPLYNSNGISFYNQNGDKTCNFRLCYGSITKPVHLQDEQFG